MQKRVADPEELDVTRGDNKHLGFGVGIHYCLGAPLARMELEVALTTIFHRLPNLRLTVPVSDLQWREAPILNGVKQLPVCWDV